MSVLQLTLAIEKWPLRVPFRISGRIFEAMDLLVVRLERDGACGWGEAAGVYYLNDQPEGMIQQLERLRPSIEAGLDREALQGLLPPGGARNALDCALWDLEARMQGRPVWQIAGLEPPRALLTTFTCGADTPEKMAATALGYEGARAIKIKLTGETMDAERVRAIRAVKSDAWLAVDANQGFTRDSLERLLPVLLETGVKLIEQPFPIGREAWLDGFDSPIPIAADESVQGVAQVATLVDRFKTVNIKLDKCGGLTEALAMARTAHSLGLGAMVGNMLGTSLAMAPAFLVGQLCQVVDLDGPVLLGTDRATRVLYRDGLVSCPQEIWGGGAAVVAAP